MATRSSKRARLGGGDQPRNQCSTVKTRKKQSKDLKHKEKNEKTNTINQQDDVLSESEGTSREENVEVKWTLLPGNHDGYDITEGEEELNTLIENEVEQLVSVEEQAANSAQGMFGEPTKFSISQERETEKTGTMNEVVSDINSESSVAHDVVEKCNNKMREMVNQHKREIEQYTMKKDEKDSLDITQEASLSGAWGSLVFQGLKYANDKALTRENPNGIMNKAFVQLGLETEGQKKVHFEAIRHYMKYRIGRMRDYFVTKVQSVVINIGT
jgi:hypothetical protein